MLLLQRSDTIHRTFKTTVGFVYAYGATWLKLFSVFLFFLFSAPAFAQNLSGKNQDTTIYTSAITKITNFKMLRDKSRQLTIDDVMKLPFTQDAKRIGFTKDAVWLKFSIANAGAIRDSLFLRIQNPLLDEIVFFSETNGVITPPITVGRSYKFGHRPVPQLPSFIYPLLVPPGHTVTIYLRVNATSPMVFPMDIGEQSAILNNGQVHLSAEAVYLGIFLIVILYSLAIFLATYDKTYFFYIIYLSCVGFSMIVISGFAYKYLWPNNVWLSMNLYVICPIATGIATCLLAQSFLNLKENSIRLYQVLNAVIAVYCIAVLFMFSHPITAIIMVYICASVAILIILFSSYVVIVMKKYRLATYFFIANAVFLASSVLYMLRTLDILPYTRVTSLTFEIGSAIEMALLTFALTDKFSRYRQQENKLRHEAFLASENAKDLLRRKNQILVNEILLRTGNLRDTNKTLTQSLEVLGKMQSRLVESEKMALLGQLTAGVAHEINNPINFVVTGINPLQAGIAELQQIVARYSNIDVNKNIGAQLKDIGRLEKEIGLEDLSSEIKLLLNGIKDGAQRTSEIVSNLQNFTHTGQDQHFVLFDVNTGIESTLLLIRNSFPPGLQLVKELALLPEIECMPGKINQVFMNIISNAIHAINARKYTQGCMPKLIISSCCKGDTVQILCKDNGVGMNEAVKEKIFEPFFSGEPHAESMGLGMFIVQNILNAHRGSIKINSKPGEGTAVLLILPLRQTPNNAKQEIV